MKRIGITLLAAGLAGAAAQNAEEPAGLQVGQPAPAFSMAGSDGRTWTLADFKGRQAVVIAWFPKAFTGG